jgi:hypothetical protein
MASVKEQAEEIIQPILGSAQEQALGPYNYSSGLNLVINLLREKNGIKGLNACRRRSLDEVCDTCAIIGRAAGNSSLEFCKLVEINNASAEPITDMHLNSEQV